MIPIAKRMILDKDTSDLTLFLHFETLVSMTDLIWLKD